MAVVKRIEAAGSKSGRTAQRVVIASCGELASKRKIMAQLEAEKARLMDQIAKRSALAAVLGYGDGHKFVRTALCSPGAVLAKFLACMAACSGAEDVGWLTDMMGVGSALWC